MTLDVNECERPEKFLIYKSEYRDELYSWKQCSAVGGRCVNEYGSYRCECLAGFVGDGFECDDIDECQLNEPKCSEHSKCVNLPGSYRCDCLEGFDTKNGTCVGKVLNLSSSGCWTLPSCKINV